ncbi:protein UPS2, mitochondrial [Colletotrichum spaethianum]|uniref:Protein UPS2, mitochondrial n=1 Tax=Colletotrichum spaethianum TaxID=700344 RepID=A0AA37UNR0_9PEZI|nr:protein UPS2, mitochondrial [Colletotrichum spaethianum]GKT49020.1 protein UPS2, mitochondrial [Colletotrichum spaethianum]
MKVFSNAVTFNYSWEEVSAANWRKYCPWNDKTTHVIAVDTLGRSVDPATGILRTERLITCKQSAPKWFASLVGGASAGADPDVSHVFETSYVDPATKTVTMVSQNLTFSNLISVQESVVYKPISATQTQFVQDAQITALCGGWQRIKNGIEDQCVSRFRDNALKGKEGFETVLAMSRRVFAEEREREMRSRQGMAA